MGDKLFYFFAGWFAVGFILVPLDLVPPWLEWANSVFLIAAGLVSVVYFLHNYGKTTGVLYSLLIFVLSISVEQFGVQTGLFFGDYEYTARFGVKILDTPITIGFAWLLVMGCADVLAKEITSNKWMQPLLGACVAVTMDLILDPVAFKVKEYWLWGDGGFYYDIPVQNFIGWFVLAFLFQAVLTLQTHTPDRVWQTRMSFIFLGMILMFSVTAFFGELVFAPVLVILLSTGWMLAYWKRRGSL